MVSEYRHGFYAQSKNNTVRVRYGTHPTIIAEKTFTSKQAAYSFIYTFGGKTEQQVGKWVVQNATPHTGQIGVKVNWTGDIKLASGHDQGRLAAFLMAKGKKPYFTVYGVSPARLAKALGISQKSLEGKTAKTAQEYGPRFVTIKADPKTVAEVFAKGASKMFAQKTKKNPVSADGITYEIKPTHISLVRAGDTILIDGKLKTLSANNIKRGFMGKTLWGDSYKAGRQLVPVAKIFHARKKNPPKRKLLKAGDPIAIKKQWRDPGDELFLFFMARDENPRSKLIDITYRERGGHGRIPAIQQVERAMITRRKGLTLPQYTSRMRQRKGK